MKKIAILLAGFSLSGCVVFDSYFMAKYDTTEYALVNSIKTKAELAQENCSDKAKMVVSVDDIYAKSLEFKNFTTYIPRNTDAVNMSSKLLQLSKDTKDFYAKTEKVSEVFCKMKLQQIVKASDTIQNTIGSKPR
jgi:hypothetical protein